MCSIAKKFFRFIKKEDGPTAVEYAVMLALIIVVCIVAITTLGSNANRTFANAALNTSAGSWPDRPRPYPLEYRGSWHRVKPVTGGVRMLTLERLAELERVLMRIEDEEHARQVRAMIEQHRAERKRAAMLPSVEPAAEKRWVVVATLPASPANPDISG
jgi:pilus assembly protein Flp/PilA